jgi:hypothetical protein
MHEQLAAYERKKNDEGNNRQYAENEYQQQQNQQQQQQTRFSRNSPILNSYAFLDDQSIMDNRSPIVSSIGSPYIKRRYVGFADDDNIDVATTKGSDLFPVEGNITPLVETNQNLNSKFETPLFRQPMTNELKINREPEEINTQISQEELDKIKKVEERSKMIDDNWDVDDLVVDENEEEENQEEEVPEKSNDNSSEPFDRVAYYNKLHPNDKTLFDAFSKFNITRNKKQLSDSKFYDYFNKTLELNNDKPNQITLDTFNGLNAINALKIIGNKHKAFELKTLNKLLK